MDKKLYKNIIDIKKKVENFILVVKPLHTYISLNNQKIKHKINNKYEKSQI